MNVSVFTWKGKEPRVSYLTEQKLLRDVLYIGTGYNLFLNVVLSILKLQSWTEQNSGKDKKMPNGLFMSLLDNSNNERQQSSLIKTSILNYVFIQIE